MKKLMIAGAAALCATVGFSDVTSANIVGYTTDSIPKMGQQKMGGASFIAVGGETLDIQTIAVGGNFEDGGVKIKWWDSVNKVYSDWAQYWTADCLSDQDYNLLGYAGWGAEDTRKIEKTFNPGEGFWFMSDTDNVTLSFSGQVYMPAQQYLGVNIPKMGQQKMVINPFPMALDIQSILVNGNFEDGGTKIKWWDSVNKVYSDWAQYWTADCLSDQDYNLLGYAGWGAEDTRKIEKTFGVGEGFWFMSDTDDVNIRIPNPFYKGE